MRTRTVALLTAVAVLAAATTPAQAAGHAGSVPAPGCGTAGYPAGYGIWCPGRIHLVTDGDSLYGLAQAYLGRGDLWPEIAILGTVSPARCSPAGSRPTQIFPGQILLIPFPGTAAPPGQPASCPSGTALAPSASTSPSRAVSAPGQHGRSATAGSRGHPAVVAGNLAPWILAVLALAALVLLARAGRRRRCKARTPAPGPGDGELASPAAQDAPGQGAPLPGSPEAGTYHDGPHCAGQNPDPSGPGQFPGAGRQAARSVPQPPPPASPAERSVLPQPERFPIGVRDGRPVTADLAALGGLGLTGPGAPAAARAIAGALLSRAQGGRSGPPGQVIVPAADAAGLLPPPAPGAGASPVPGLSQPLTLAAALDETETLTLSRARLADAGDDEDGPGTGATAAGLTAALMAAPDPAATQRLRTITATARRLGIAVIVLGPWPYGTTCHVAADGTITRVTPADPGLHGVRLFRLTPDELTAITSPARPAGPARQAPATRTAAPPASPAAGIPPAPGPRPPGGGISAVPEAVPAQADPLPAGSPAGRAGRPVQVGVLGPLRITAAGHEIGGGPRKARELLAFLAVQGQDGATAEQVSEALWPGLPPGRGASQRNTALRKARELLRQSAGLPSPMWITLTADRYRLDPDLIDVDLRDFQAALDTARAAASAQARLAARRQAAGCYRGPLCDGAGYDWAEPYAETARRQALDNWAHIAEILRDTDPEQAMAALEAAITHDPYNEYTYQQLMRLQAAAGRTDAVRRTLQLLQARLREIGVPAVAASTRQVIAGLLDGTGPHPAAGPAPRHSTNSTQHPGPRTSPGIRRLQASTRQPPVQTPPQEGTAAGRKSGNATT
jgi:DNA-binding SARP family transcriptional activator